jgi:glucose-6-phosphate 1-epimerase
MIHLQLAKNKVGISAGVTQYEDENGLQFLSVENSHTTATIALQGAHVMHWQPKSATQPVLWLSSNARYTEGRSIRGGIPICWPWFGAHPTDSSYCPHGFARVIPWKVLQTSILANGATRLLLEMTHTDVTKKQLSYDYRFVLAMTIGETLRLEMMTTNLASHPFMIGEAFHTYFNISDIDHIQITGLENLVFSDKVAGYERNVQHGPIKFDGEFDRVYLNSRRDCVIHDAGYERKIRVTKSCSHTTIIWTPWGEKASQMGDMGTVNEWRQMICLESANAMENSVTIYPNETHTMVTEYSLEALNK